MLHEGGIRDGQVFVKLLTNRAACHLSLARPLKALQDCTMAVQVCTVACHSLLPCLFSSFCLPSLTHSVHYPTCIHATTRSCMHSFTHPPTHPSTHPSIYQSAHSFTHPSTYPSVHTSIHQPTHESTDPSIHLCFHPPTHPSMHKPNPSTIPSIHYSHPLIPAKGLLAILCGRQLSCLLARLFQAGLACSPEVRQLIVLLSWCIGGAHTCISCHESWE